MQTSSARPVGRLVYALVAVTVGVVNVVTFRSTLPLTVKLEILGATALVYLAATFLVARLTGETREAAQSVADPPQRPGGGAAGAPIGSTAISRHRWLTTALRLDLGVALGMLLALAAGTGVAYLCRWSAWSVPLCFVAMFATAYLVIRTVKCPVCGMPASDDGTVRRSQWHPPALNPFYPELT